MKTMLVITVALVLATINGGESRFVINHRPARDVENNAPIATKLTELASRGFMGGHINWQGTQNDDTADSAKSSDLASRGTAFVASYPEAGEHVADDLLKSQGGQREARGLESFQRSKRSHPQTDNDGAASAKGNDPVARGSAFVASYPGAEQQVADDILKSQSGQREARGLESFQRSKRSHPQADNDGAASAKGNDPASRGTAFVASYPGAEQHIADDLLKSQGGQREARGLESFQRSKRSHPQTDNDGAASAKGNDPASRGSAFVASYPGAEQQVADDLLKSQGGQREARALESIQRSKRNNPEADNNDAANAKGSDLATRDFVGKTVTSWDGTQNDDAADSVKGSDPASRGTAFVASYPGAEQQVADDILKSQGGQREARGLESFQRSKRSHPQADNDGAASAKGNDPASRGTAFVASYPGAEQQVADGILKSQGGQREARGLESFQRSKRSHPQADNDGAASAKGNDPASRGSAFVASYPGAEQQVADDLLKSQGGQRDARALESIQRSKRNNPKADNNDAANAKGSDPAARDFVGKTVTSWDGTQNDDAADSVKGSDPASRGTAFVASYPGAEQHIADDLLKSQGGQREARGLESFQRSKRSHPQADNDGAASAKGNDPASRGTAFVASYSGAEQHVADDLLKSQGGQREARGLESFQRSKRSHPQADNDGAASAKGNDPASRGTAFVASYPGAEQHVADDLLKSQGGQREARGLESFQRSKRNNPQADNNEAASAKGNDPAVRDFVGKTVTSWDGTQNDDAADSVKGSDPASRGTAFVASYTGAQEQVADEISGKSARVARKLGGSSCAKCSSHDDENEDVSRGYLHYASLDGGESRSYHETQEKGVGDPLKSDVGKRAARALANIPRAKRSSHDSDNEGVNLKDAKQASGEFHRDYIKSNRGSRAAGGLAESPSVSANENDPASRQAVFVGDDVVEEKGSAPVKRSDSNVDGNKVANLNGNEPISRGIGDFVSWDGAHKDDASSSGDNREARAAANENDPASRGIIFSGAWDGNQKDDKEDGVLKSNGAERAARGVAGFPLVKRSDSNSESNKVASLNGNDPISRGITSFLSWDGSQKDDKEDGVLKSNGAERATRGVTGYPLVRRSDSNSENDKVANLNGNEPISRGIGNFYSWDGAHKDDVSSSGDNREARGAANENDPASRGIIFSGAWDGNQKDDKEDGVLKSNGAERAARGVAGFPLVKRSDSNSESNKVASLNGNDPISRGITSFLSWDGSQKDDKEDGVLKSNGAERATRGVAGYPLVKRSDSNSENDKVANLNGNEPISRGIGNFYSWDGAHKDDVSSSGDNREARGAANENDPASRGIIFSGAWDGNQKDDKEDGVLKSNGAERAARGVAGFPLVKRSDSNSESNKVASLNGNDPISRGITSFLSWDGSQKDNEDDGALRSNSPTWRGISSFLSWDGTHKNDEGVGSNSGHRAAREAAEHPVALANENDSASRGITYIR